MKKIYQVATVVALLFAPLALSASASAEFKCEIGYTGPNSENMCVSEEVYKCEVKNENEVTIRNSTDQEVASGTVSVEDNGEGGDAVSGDVSNDSGATFNVTIENDSCSVAQAVVPAEEVPETPEQPGQPVQPEQTEQTEPGRGATSAAVQPTQNVTPSALPVTSGDTAPAIFLTGGVVSAVALAVAYRRLY